MQPINEPLVTSRLKVLEAVAAAGVSITFVKLTPNGVSFLVPQSAAQAAQQALAANAVHFDIQSGKSVVQVHAVNIRDEEGLVAKVLQIAIEASAVLDHIGDMHDRVLLVVPDKMAPELAKKLMDSLEAGS